LRNAISGRPVFFPLFSPDGTLFPGIFGPYQAYSIIRHPSDIHSRTFSFNLNHHFESPLFVRHFKLLFKAILFLLPYYYDQFGRHASQVWVVWTKSVPGPRSQPIWPASVQKNRSKWAHFIKKRSCSTFLEI